MLGKHTEKMNYPISKSAFANAVSH